MKGRFSAMIIGWIETPLLLLPNFCTTDWISRISCSSSSRSWLQGLCVTRNKTPLKYGRFLSGASSYLFPLVSREHSVEVFKIHDCINLKYSQELQFRSIKWEIMRALRPANFQHCKYDYWAQILLTFASSMSVQTVPFILDYKKKRIANSLLELMQRHCIVK